MADGKRAAVAASERCELIELGPVNATIHKVDERVAVADLAALADLYLALLESLLGSNA